MVANKRAKVVSTSSPSFSFSSSNSKPDHPEDNLEQEQVVNSPLPFSTMLLTGHTSTITSLSFNTHGTALLSSAFDKKVFLWNIGSYCDNYNVLPTNYFKNSVTQVCWFGDNIITGCADKTVQIFDGNTCTRVKKYAVHSSVVNSIDTSNKSTSGCDLIVSGSDDRTLKIYDTRSNSKHEMMSFTSSYQVCAVAFNSDCNSVFSGGVDNNVYQWDTRKASSSSSDEAGAGAGKDVSSQALTLTLQGHTDTITALSLSPTGTHLLSNSMDNTLISWDVQPYHNAQTTRLHRQFTGHKHNSEKRLLKCSWSPDGEMVTSGSSDGVVNVWDYETSEVLYQLPGHKGVVVDVKFRPVTEGGKNVLGSGGSDKEIYLGEL